MADKKISALTSLAQGDVAVTTDVLPIVDTSATETKKVTAAALVGAGLAAGVTSVDINSGSIDGTTIGANSAAAGTFTNLTASGTVSFSGATVSNGGSVTTVDINGGTIDGATIATSDITVGSGKTLNVSAGTLTLADNQISGDKVEGGTINAITINTLTSTAVNATTVDATNVEVTNVKAKDGTAAATIADSTGVVSITANPILSGGTANGVLYLNGSKVATSGSALTFTGTNLGIGTASAATPLEITSTTLNAIRMTLGSEARTHNISAVNNGRDLAILPFRNATLQAGNGTTEGVLTLNAYEYTVFGTGASYTERMRLTDTGLGIGTSSPAAKLDVVGQVRGTYNAGSTDTSAYAFRFATSTNTDRVLWGGYDNTANIGFIQATELGVAHTSLVLNPNGGNLGLGVTPGTWNTGYRAFQFGATGALYSAVSGTDFVSLDYNVIVDASNSVYKQTDVATRYRQISGQHQWFNAPSGTAGNAITFTQAMTLDASGNLGIGTTSPINNAGYGGLSLNGTSGALFSLMTNGTESSRIASIGDVTSIQCKASTGYITFVQGVSGGTERARITSGGTLLVGKTSDDDTTAGFRYNAANYYLSLVRDGNPALVLNRLSSDGGIQEFWRSGSVVGSISVTTTATAYNTSSDRRLKENIASADDAGSVIDAIEVVKHDWKAGGSTRYGVIAQDLHAVAPEAVKVGDDNEELFDPWGVDYSKLVPMLIKEVQSLRKRVAELEAK